MASLPSVALPTTINLEPDLKRHHHHHPSPPPHFASDKSNVVSYRRGPISTHLGGGGGGEQTKLLGVSKALSLLGEGRQVEPFYYSPLLEHCVEKKSIRLTEMVHAHMIKTGIHGDNFTMTFLVNVYVQSGSMGHARKAFDCLPWRNMAAWNTLMMGNVQESKPEVAIDVFVEMLETGSFPTFFTLGLLLNACTSLNDQKLGRQVHGFMMKYRADHITSFGNALCSMYSKFGKLGHAVKAFSKIEEKDVISWTGVINACGDNGKAKRGIMYFIDMLLDDVEPNRYTLAIVLSLCCSGQYLELGKQLHAMSIKLGCGSNMKIKNSVMYLYLRCGCIDEASSMFDGEKSFNLVTYNSMIAGLAHAMELAKDGLAAHNCGAEALRIYTKLNRSGMKVDLFTLSSALTVCVRMTALEQGEQIHAQVIKSGFLSDEVVGTGLVNMYNKCGSVDRASQAFLEMASRTMISWTSMIACFAQHGLSRQALQLFEDMRLTGLTPNVVTFVSLLSACSIGGLVDEALAYFEMMQKQYKIKPVLDHYGCLVDMFVRLGRLDEALNIVKGMELEPNEFIWMLLISGCRTHGNQDMGFFAAEKLLDLKPKDHRTYVTLLNMYISAERWKDISRVRKLMKQEKPRRWRDCSWINIKDKTFYFNENDRWDQHNAVTYALLEELLEEAKEFGYQPSVNIDVTDDEDDEQETKASSSGGHHSEKLAIAYGLLNVHCDAPVRVIKSTSMCKDCHDFIKVLSMMRSRRIIVRDSTRLHVFDNGLCSCADAHGL